MNSQCVTIVHGGFRIESSNSPNQGNTMNAYTGKKYSVYTLVVCLRKRGVQ